jgi:hypothetical protein
VSVLASHLGLPRDDVVEATLAGRAYSALSLHRPLDDKTGGDPVPFAATVGASTWTTSSKLRPVRPSPRWRLRSYPPAEVPRTRERPGEDAAEPIASRADSATSTAPARATAVTRLATCGRTISAPGGRVGRPRATPRSRYAGMWRRPAPGKPSATTAARSINASRVCRFSSSRLISAPVSR